jgi:hypothetical protein
MHIWPAILLAPLLVLVDQSVTYAMVGWACRSQHELPIHAVHAFFFLATVATMIAPFKVLETHPIHSFMGSEDDGPDVLAITAIGVALLSALTILAMWLPQWFLSPCHG